MALLANLRTRWAAIGAACAVTLGGGTFGIVQASVSSGDRAIYVPISPVRVLDTRSDVGVATIQDATPALLTVTGNIATTTGQQNVVPTGASSVVINVTAINPTSDGFVSLRPGDAIGAPSVSTLNVTVGGTFPNGATITLPTSGGSAGQIQIWYEAYAATGGTTDLLIDVVGYYANHNHDDRYYTETEVDTALASKASASDLESGLASKAGTSDAARTADITSLLAPTVPSVPVTLDSNDDGGSGTSITIGSNGNPIISYYDQTKGDLKVAACKNPTCSGATENDRSTNTTLDSNERVGRYTSIAIGTNGNPIISYYDDANGDLKVAACNSPTCTTSINTTLDNNGGMFTSIAIGTNGNPIISYYDNANGSLKVAACIDPTCTTATKSTIDNSNDMVGAFTSIAIGANGNPIISYLDNANKHLKVAACNNPTCTTSTKSTIDSAGEVGQFTSIAIGANGNPIISYHDITNGDLKVAACKNPTCSGATGNDRSTNTTIDNNNNVGGHTSIAIGINGNPIISYSDNASFDLKVAACIDPTCTTATKSTIDSTGTVGQYTSIAIGINGNPIISYFESTGYALKVASCDDPTCTSSTFTTIDNSARVGWYSSIAIGTNGNPIISHYDNTNGDLKVAACKNPTCSGATNITLDSNEDVGGFTSIAIGTNGNPIISYADGTNGDLKVFSPWWLAGGR